MKKKNESREIGTVTAAASIGCSRGTAHRIARRLGLGELVVGRWLLSESEIALIRAEFRGRAGRPLGTKNSRKRVKRESK